MKNIFIILGLLTLPLMAAANCSTSANCDWDKHFADQNKAFEESMTRQREAMLRQVDQDNRDQQLQHFYDPLPATPQAPPATRRGLEYRPLGG